jgi:hypothetical protein
VGVFYFGIGEFIVARINIEEEWFSDPRRLRLIDLKKSKYEADGMAVLMWFLAQRYWFKNELIPEHAWIGSGMEEVLFEVGLASRVEGGIYVRGSERHFEWYFKKVESGKLGGKKSAQRPRDAQGRLTKVQAPLGENPQAPPKHQPSAPNPLPLPLPPSQEEDTTIALVDQIRMAWEVWGETLQAFEIPKQRMAPSQESSIARAIKQIGFENVLLALEGNRYEKPTDNFEPKDHLSVDRALHRDAKGQSRWEKFANMALTTNKKLQPKQRGRRIVQGPLPESIND